MHREPLSLSRYITLGPAERWGGALISLSLTSIQPGPPQTTTAMFWKGSKAAINTDPEELAKRGLDPQAIADATKSKEERWFLMKLDIFLLTFGCCSQVIKYIGGWDHGDLFDGLPPY